MTAGERYPPTPVLAEALAATFPGRRIVGLERAAFGYATSSPLEHATVELDDGSSLELVVKDLRWSSLIGDAPDAKPEWLHAPSRQIGVHRHLLANAGVRPQLRAAGSGRPPDGEWLAVERIDGNPLWEIGDFGIWEKVAAWLAGFHATMRDEVERARGAVPELLVYSPEWTRQWCVRARSAIEDSEDPRKNEALAILHASDELLRPVWAGEPTVIHGELYPSNVLVEHATAGARGAEVCPIDWELCGTGEPLLDLAALITGWPADEAHVLLDRYAAAARPRAERAGNDPTRTVAACRVAHAIRWLGWSPGWRPPADHDNDWVDELITQAAIAGR